MTTPLALRDVEPGTTVTITHPGHPRNGQTLTVLRPVDRGELTARFTPGVWVARTADPRPFALWADVRVTR